MKFNRVYLPQQKAIQTRQMNASNDAFARQPAAAVSNRAGSALSMPFARPEQNGFGPNNRILVIANNFPPIKGGSPTVYVNLARHLRDRVVVLAPKTNYKDGTPLIGWQQHDQAASYKIHRLPLLRTRLDQEKIPGFLGCFRFMVSDLWIRARVSASILWLVLFCKIRIICIGELLASAWLIAMCGWIPFIRTVTYVHGEEITTEDGYDNNHRRAATALVKSDGIIAVSLFTQNAIQTLLGPAASTKNICLIENGVDLNRFRVVDRRADLVDRYGLADHTVFVSVSRLIEKKGIDNAIKAFSEVVATHPDCRFLIVGHGPYEQDLRMLASDLRIAEQVIFTGEVSDEDLAAHYCLGDIFIMPNRELPNGDTEGFGLVFLEANSCGLPVIAGQDGGSKNAVKHGFNGLVVDGHSVAAIAKAMQTLMDDDGLISTLRHGAEIISRAANWQHKCQQFEDFCDALCCVSSQQSWTPLSTA